MHTEIYHPNIGKTRLHQRQHVVAEVRKIYKDDQGSGSFKDDNNKEILPQYGDQLEMEIRTYSYGRLDKTQSRK